METETAIRKVKERVKQKEMAAPKAWLKVKMGLTAKVELRESQLAKS
jgi:hypothetical protein